MRGGKRPGTGAPRVRIASAEWAAIDDIAVSHGFETMVIDGERLSARVQFLLALMNGDVATVRFDGVEDLRWFLEWIESMPVSHPLYANVPGQVARQLRATLAREMDSD